MTTLAARPPVRRRGRALLALLLLAALLGLSGPSSALPGDPPVAPVGPADGAALPVDPDGIPVVYTCPVYRSYDAGDGFVVYGGRPQYNVYFATSPTLAADGRLDLADVVGIAGPDQVQDPDLPPDQCRGYLYDSSSRAQEIPGTYYWQAFRICTGCPGGYESGPVQSFTLTLAGSSVGLALQAPAKVYRGFAAIANLATTGLSTGEPVAVQGQVAGAWKTIGRGTVTADQAVVPFRAPRGTKSLRAVYAASATEVVTSASRGVQVLAPKSWPDAKTWAGKWKGSVSVSSQDDSTASFKVAGNPSYLTKGTFRLTLLCPNPGGPSPTTIQIADAIVPKTAVAPDGTFVRAVADNQHAILLYGRLRHRKATGTVSLSLGTCAGSGRITLHHT